jgi:hypothetical protein
MAYVHRASNEPEKQSPESRLLAEAERALRCGMYPALGNLSCDYQGGVLVLQGCLPSYYLKQVAQEVVVHQVQGIRRLDNRIQVV